jgi:hypothetical protein
VPPWPGGTNRRAGGSRGRGADSAEPTNQGPVANFTVPARAVTPDGLRGMLRRVTIAVKSHHTAQAEAILARAGLTGTAGRTAPPCAEAAARSAGVSSGCPPSTW